MPQRTRTAPQQGRDVEIALEGERATLGLLLLLFILSVASIALYLGLSSLVRFSFAILYYTVLVKLSLVGNPGLAKLLIHLVVCLPLLLPTWWVVISIARKWKDPGSISINVIKRGILLQALFVAAFIVVVLVAELLLPIYLLSPVRGSVNRFVSDARWSMGTNSTRVIEEVVRYVNGNIRHTWNKPEAVLEMDNLLSPVDYHILNLIGFDRAHVILFQKWGSCGQYAIVTTYLLNRLGYEVRRAVFVERDHEWAEVKINENWYIVDPWYIGLAYKKNHLLVPVEKLASLQPFAGNYTVIVIYPNGTRIDATEEHGYVLSHQD